MPTCFHVPFQNPPKSHQKSILAGIDSFIYFSIDLFRFGLDFGTQLGAMLASKIAQGLPEMPPKTGLGAISRPDPLQASIFIDF